MRRLEPSLQKGGSSLCRVAWYTLLIMASKKQRVDIGNATIAGRSDYTNTLSAIIDGDFCPFCEEHLSKHHSNPLIYKSAHWLVTKNAWPYDGAAFHFLFIARTHIEAIGNISPAAWTDLHALYKKLAKRHRIDGATLMMRSGNTKRTGASVNHLHAHLVVGAKRTEKALPIKAIVGFKR